LLLTVTNCYKDLQKEKKQGFYTLLKKLKFFQKQLRFSKNFPYIYGSAKRNQEKNKRRKRK